MFKLLKTGIPLSFAVLLAIFIFSCDTSMGFGPIIDLEAPELIITGITLPDGEEYPISEEGGKLVLGRGILVGSGAVLKGKAKDNVKIERIVVEEIGDNATITNGARKTWTTSNFGESDKNRFRSWSIVLDGIEKGERVIEITAYDSSYPPNIGPDTVKQLTLLVDTDLPVVKNVKIERKAGIQIDLLPGTVLTDMDANQFLNIDYFQNERFSIRASIDHDFPLADVTLNFLDAGNELFPDWLPFTGGSLYEPLWEIDADLLISANGKFATGRHNLGVVITAKAEAGNIGQYEDRQNMLYSFCWFPESDYPRIEIQAEEPVIIEKGAMIPVIAFDDDNLKTMHTAMIPAAEWNALPGADDEAKLESLDTLTYKEWMNGQTVRNTQIPADINSERGDYRLAVIVRDNKDSESAEVFSRKVFYVTVIEEGIPVISIDSHKENDIPKLTGGRKFTLSGFVTNLDEVSVFRMAWISADESAADQITTGQNALKNNLPNANVKIWELPLSPMPDKKIGNKYYKQQSFTKTFDIFDDFNGEPAAKKAMFFMMYTEKSGNESFQTLRLMPHTRPPVIKVNDPQNMSEFASNDTINFNIEVSSQDGLNITGVELRSFNDNKVINLSLVNGVWTGTNSHKELGNYRYIITATDQMENKEQHELYIVVAQLPGLLYVTSPHNPAIFSGRDTITIDAVFERAVNTVDTHENLLIPTIPVIRLEGFTDGLPRYAKYTDGKGSTVLKFEYAVQNNDETGVDGLKATAILPRGALISALGFDVDEYLLDANDTMPETVRLDIDAVAPTVTGITVTGAADREWYRAGEDLTIRVTTSKPVMVLGNPQMTMPFNVNPPRSALFQKTEVNNTVMVFNYKVQDGDEAKPLELNTGLSLTGAIDIITDRVGVEGGNRLAAGSTNYTTGIFIDAIKPPKLNVEEISEFTTPTERRFKITNKNDIESDAAVEYTTNGLTYTTDGLTNNNGEYTFKITAGQGSNTYSVAARQTDRAGNISDDGNLITFSMGNNNNLVSVICENPNGAYPLDSKMIFKLTFSGGVSYDGQGSASITIQGGGGGNTGAVKLNIPVTAEKSNFLYVEWTVPEGITMIPVTLTDINLTGIKKENNTIFNIGDDGLQDQIDGVKGDFNRPDLKVMSVRPRITQMIGQNVPAPNAVLSPTGNNSVLTLTFSHSVWTENGRIKVRPYGNWYIPPVLSNSDYNKVSSALSGTNLTTLENYYKETTHGLLKNNSGQYTGTPDTATKYVLDFNTGISGTTGVVAQLRTVFNNANYLLQDIDVVTSVVTGTGGSSLLNGSTEVEIHLDKLPDGRQWLVEIDEGAFRDEAGNTFAGWTSANANWFWSQKTAEPVIRVNRVSNNAANDDAIEDYYPAAIFQTKVQYRIDCETPDAAITYGTSVNTDGTSKFPAGSEKVSEITGTMTSTSIYKPSTTDGAQNSQLSDATAAQLQNTGIINPTASTYTYNSANPLTIGDNNLYSARKDYIAAKATRSLLTDSATGYEGAFKTVIVYRNVEDQVYTNGWVKFEGTNLYGGATTISGFPLSNNDMSGQKSKFAYRIEDENNIDWVWITWEIVCDFWHVGLIVDDTNPQANLFNMGVGWNFTEDQGTHSLRKYGNWGLRVGTSR